MAAVTTIIAAVGLGIAAVGAGVSAYGTMKQAEASQKAEKLRERQMNLDAMRKRREIVRQMILQQAAGRANAAEQGASGMGDSAVAGAFAQQTGTAARNVMDVNQSQEIGSGIFRANAQYAQGQATSAWGSSFQSVGGAMVNNAGTISRVGASAGLWAPEPA